MPSNLKNLQSNIICTKVEHHLYKSRTSFVQKSNIICTNWGFFRKLSPEMILKWDLKINFFKMFGDNSKTNLNAIKLKKFTVEHHLYKSRTSFVQTGAFFGNYHLR